VLRPRHPGPDVTGTPARRIPVAATEPISCSLTAAEVPARIEQIERLRARLDHVERTGHGVLLRFPADSDLAAELRRFVEDESRCCRFWTFTLGATTDGLTLHWDGPPDADELLDRFHAYFRAVGPVQWG
jgi:MerR family transcriptional regulator, copper efflux regulator